VALFGGEVLEAIYEQGFLGCPGRGLILGLT